MPNTNAREDALALEWRYSINFGPNGEENWANLITPQGELVSNIRTHHALAIVAGINAYLEATRRTSLIPPDRAGMIEALVKVIDLSDADDLPEAELLEKAGTIAREAITALSLPAPVAETGWVVVPEDLLTHIGDWVVACQIAHDVAPPPRADEDDRSYWRHQLQTLDNIRAMLASAPTPVSGEVAEPVAWRSLVNSFGRAGFEYANTEQELIDRGRHARQPLYASPQIEELSPMPVTVGWHIGLAAAIRAAKMALFILNRGEKPNDSWRAGIERDIATAEAMLASAPT